MSALVESVQRCGSMSCLLKLTQRIFAPDGELVSQGFTFQRVQRDYALYVAKLLESGRNDQGEAHVGMIEAETGVGKTLAYLVPLALYCGLTGKRAGISTFTLHLQRQILDGRDWEVAQSLVHKHTGRTLTLERRLGMRNFVSPARIDALLHDWTDAPKEVHDFSKWAHHSAQEGSGLLDDWRDEHGPLPCGLLDDQVCLSGWEDVEAVNPQFIDHVRASKEADILLTSHAMTVLNAMNWHSLLDGPEGLHLSAVILDEADRLFSAAESITRLSLQPKTLLRQIEVSTAVFPEASGSDTLMGLVDDLDAWIVSLNENTDETELLIDDEQAGQVQPKLADAHQSLANYLEVVESIYDAPGLWTERQHIVFDSLKKSLNFLGQYQECLFDEASRVQWVTSIAWTPIRKLASFRLSHLYPARAVNRLWVKLPNRKNSYVESVLLTSATLSNPGNTSFTDCAMNIGLYAGHLRAFPDQRLSPDRFGTIAFVLADPLAPYPTADLNPETNNADDDCSRTNPEWLNYTARMINAAGDVGITLVLTTSYRDAFELGRRLFNIGRRDVLVHTAGNKLVDVISRLQSTVSEAGILITPAAWEGVSLRDSEGRQLIKNLVITRLPFSPPDTAVSRALIKAMKARKPSMTEESYLRTVFLRRQGDAVRKFRQGLGRAIRHHSDEVTVWISDPRFPLPKAAYEDERIGKSPVVHRGFVKAISARFIDDYESCHVFMADSTVIQPEIVESVF